MIQFPNISPDIFSFELFGFNFAIRWYAVSYIVGFILSLMIMKFFLKRVACWTNSYPPMHEENSDSLLTYLIVGVLLGGRLGYVLFYNFTYYLERPIDILRVWDGGMSFHGGFLGVVFSGILYARLNKVPVLSCADLIAISSPPGLFLGRIANFINAELWGKPTDVSWGIIFPGAAAQACPGVLDLCARHPTQLYEALLEGCFLFILLFTMGLLGYLKKPGLITGVFLLGYGVSRFFVEFYRVPDQQFFSDVNPNGFAHSFGDFGVTMGQLLSLPMISFGIVLIIFAQSIVRRLV